MPIPPCQPKCLFHSRTQRSNLRLRLYALFVSYPISGGRFANRPIILNFQCQVVQLNRLDWRAYIERQLIRKFVSIPTEIQAQLDTLTPTQLEAFAEALLEFTDPADVQQWLAAHL